MVDTHDAFEALSYAWGESTQSENSQCNGIDALITLSLAEALRALRRPNQPR
jgi:hypothetical protein